MKKILFLIAFLIGCSQAQADEGMWLLQMIEEQHLADSLRKAGLKLPVSELYSEQHPSLREVVGIFGSGCTGEVISKEGLILTNNHCGIESLHPISTIDKNYLQEGFFAQQRSEEIPVPNLTFRFIIRIEDVTTAVQTYAQRENIDLGTIRDEDLLDRMGRRWLRDTDLAKRKGIQAQICSFYAGNRFYMVYMQEYSDVRLVVNPPQNVAQFGGNSDNWVWPRHNPDFAIFRVYAAQNGQPAEYSKDNVPLKCRRALPISLSGFSEGDYTMIMGFPGSTQRNLTQGQLSFLTESYNPPLIEGGRLTQETLWKYMQSNKDENLALSNDYFDVGNLVKMLSGEQEVIIREKLKEKAQVRSLSLATWAHQTGTPAYQHVSDQLDSLCKVYADTIHDYILFVQVYRQFRHLLRTSIAEYLGDVGIDDYNEFLEEYLYQPRTYEKELAEKLLKLYYQKKRLPMDMLGLGNAKTAVAVFDKVYNTSILTDSLRLEKFLKKPSKRKLEQDAMLKLSTAFKKAESTRIEASDAYERYVKQEQTLEGIFVRGLSEMTQWSKAPDANFTLRLTYGHVADLYSTDKKRYGYETTLDGMIAKEDANNPDYVLHPRMRELYQVKKYGRYANKEGKLPACFITTNDITGGNSGSPVLNAEGQLIGCAFDGNLEGLGGDLEYNIHTQRAIVADIRFILWVTDIFGGSHYVIDELDIR